MSERLRVAYEQKYLLELAKRIQAKNMGFLTKQRMAGKLFKERHGISDNDDQILDHRKDLFYKWS